MTSLRAIARAVSLIAIYTTPFWAHDTHAQARLRQALSANQLPVAQATAPDEILANDNRTPAGNLQKGVVNLSLEIRSGTWHAEAEDGPPLFVPAFGETGKPAQIPGPLLRVTADTTIHVTITNKLTTPATVFGFVTHPATSDPGVEIAPNQSREITFSAGAPGTYFYWARTTSPLKFRFAGNQPFNAFGHGVFPFKVDSQLNGAFVVDPPGQVPADRIFVINEMEADGDVLHKRFDVMTINGKDYPYTEPLQYTMSDTIRWRIVNASVIDHAMHLHGAFYKVLSSGDLYKDTQYSPDEQQTVVTQDIPAGDTMLMEWTPSHPGRWLFHCHYAVHTITDVRVPIYGRRLANVHAVPEAVAGTALPPDPKMAMADMAGLVLGINVLPKRGALPAQDAHNPRKIELSLQPSSADGESKFISCAIREGAKVATSTNQYAGPPLVLTRGEPVEITVVNHLSEPTTIHWHGIEVDSYYDGVMGAGVGDQMTPEIAPGGSFVVRFTPTHAGTFIYHEHSSHPWQMAEGIYGAIIVLNPGEKYDPEHELLMVIGARNLGLGPPMTVNGSDTFPEISLQRGVNYRVRVVNIAPSLEADVSLGSIQDPVTWTEIAKDGVAVPARLAKPQSAFVHIVSGETYDFELREDNPGEIPIEVVNWIYRTKLAGEITVH